MKIKELLTEPELKALKAALEADIPDCEHGFILRELSYYQHLLKGEKNEVGVHSEDNFDNPAKVAFCAPFPFGIVDGVLEHGEGFLEQEVPKGKSREDYVEHCLIEVSQNPSRVLSQAEATKRMGLTPRCLQMWVKQGLRTFKIGRSTFYAQKDLEDFAQQAGHLLQKDGKILKKVGRYGFRV